MRKLAIFTRRPEPAGRIAGDDPRSEAASASHWAALDDAALLVAIGRWRQEALAEVYRRHGGATFSLARRVLVDRSLAEEVTQDVFMRLWTEPEAFDQRRGTLRSYLLMMAHRRAVDRLRQDTARRDREVRAARRRATSGYDLEQEVADLVVAAQLKEALEVLTPDERQAIELAYFGGQTYRQVATSLGEPEGTIKSRIRSGLGQLREALGSAGWEAR